MPIQFDNSIVHDHGTPQNVEESFVIYSNWSKIHDFKFDNILEESSETPSAGSLWDSYTVFDDDMPFDVVIEYDVDGAGHGVIIKYDSDASTYMVFGLTSDGKLVIYDYADSTLTKLYEKPTSGALYGSVKVMTRQQRFSEDETDVWHTLSMWIDDALIGTHTIHTGTADENSYQVGVCNQSTSRTFTNIRIPQLTEFTEWSSVDPGESPQGGLERSIEGRYVKYFIRFDGAMRAWTSRVGGSVWTFDEEEYYLLRYMYDKRQIYNHIRMTGGYAQAEFVRADLIAKYGHKFAEINNPYLMTEIACRREAERQINRMEEKFSTETILTQFTPTVEVEDHVTTEISERIVSSRKWVFSPGTIDQELSLRGYTGRYGS